MTMADNKPIVTNGYPILELNTLVPLLDNYEDKTKFPIPRNMYLMMCMQK